MMQPEAGEDAKTGSDDDWSVVEETEATRKRHPDEQVHRASAVELRAAPVDRTEDAKQKEFNSSRISEGTPLEDTYNNIKGLLKHSLGFKSAAREEVGQTVAGSNNSDSPIPESCPSLSPKTPSRVPIAKVMEKHGLPYHADQEKEALGCRPLPKISMASTESSSGSTVTTEEVNVLRRQRVVHTSPASFNQEKWQGSGNEPLVIDGVCPVEEDAGAQSPKKAHDPMHADNSDVASDLSSPEDFRGNEAAEQLERDIRAATRPLKVEPTRSIRQHKILVVGQKACGKSTFMSCLTASLKDREMDGEYGQIYQVRGWIEDAGSGCTHHFTVQELQAEELHDPVALLHGACSLIVQCAQNYLELEQDKQREGLISAYEDARVDVCLWFLPPHYVSKAELRCLNQLRTILPVIPVLSKADTMTDTEVTALVLEVEDSIACYDEMLTQQQKAPKQPTPDALNITGGIQGGIFAISSSLEMDYSMNSSGWPVRDYPWGTVEPLASSHSDLLKLTETLLELSPERLKEATEERFTQYRARQLTDTNTAPKCLTIFRRPSFKKLLYACFLAYTVFCILMTTCALGAQVSSSFHGWMTGLQPENDRLTRSSAGEYRDFGKPGEPSLGSAANNKYRPGSQYGDAALSQKVDKALDEASAMGGKPAAGVESYKEEVRQNTNMLKGLPKKVKAEALDAIKAKLATDDKTKQVAAAGSIKPWFQALESSLPNILKPQKHTGRLKGRPFAGKLKRKAKKLLKRAKKAKTKLLHSASGVKDSLGTFLGDLDTKRLVRRALFAHAWL